MRDLWVLFYTCPFFVVILHIYRHPCNRDSSSFGVPPCSGPPTFLRQGTRCSSLSDHYSVLSAQLPPPFFHLTGASLVPACFIHPNCYHRPHLKKNTKPFFPPGAPRIVTSPSWNLCLSEENHFPLPLTLFFVSLLGTTHLTELTFRPSPPKKHAGGNDTFSQPQARRVRPLSPISFFSRPADPVLPFLGLALECYGRPLPIVA